MRFSTVVWAAIVTVSLCFAQLSLAQTVPETDGAPYPPTSNSLSLLTPPKQEGPVVVKVGFEFHDILEIRDGEEVFDFSGVLTLVWNDPRQAFDPRIEGADERVFQGNYQFNELAPSWYPQVVLANEAGSYQSSGVVLRIQPDGTATLIQTITATANVEISVRRYPFDKHRFAAIFEVLGFDRNEVLLELATTSSDIGFADDIRVPQWDTTASKMEIVDRVESYAGADGVASSFVASVYMKRDSFYVIRLVVVPLTVIVLLSFSVFWMDRSSLGDRISVSFIGILTGVAYQLLISDKLPQVSYFTLIHGFLNLSFFTMCSTVLINLVVGKLDQRGKQMLGDLIDRRCRWIFPSIFFGLSLVMVTIAFVFY